MPIPSGYVSGQVVQAVPTSVATAIFNETQASGTAGGTFTSGSYVKRTLNTTVVNNIAGCSIASSVITLPAGTYEVFASAPAFSVNAHHIRFANTTDSLYYYGSNSKAPTANADSDCNLSLLTTYFTITGAKSFELQHRCGSTRATDGLGITTTFGDSEIYSQITITKVA